MEKKRIYLDNDGSFIQHKEKFKPTEGIVKCVNNKRLYENDNGQIYWKTLSTIKVGEHYKVTHESKSYYVVRAKNYTGLMRKSYFTKRVRDKGNTVKIQGLEYTITDDIMYHVCNMLDIDFPEIDNLKEGNTYWSISSDGDVIKNKVGSMGQKDIMYIRHLEMKNVFLTERDAEHGVKKLKEMRK